MRGIIKIMKNRNYYCRIIVKNWKNFFHIAKQYESNPSAYKGKLFCKKTGDSIGWFYLASHPKTKEMIMRHDVFQPEEIEVHKWDEVVIC